MPRGRSKSSKEVAKEAGVSKHSEMLKIGDVETQIDGVSRDTPLKSSKAVTKEGVKIFTPSELNLSQDQL